MYVPMYVRVCVSVSVRKDVHAQLTHCKDARTRAKQRTNAKQSKGADRKKTFFCFSSVAAIDQTYLLVVKKGLCWRR